MNKFFSSGVFFAVTLSAMMLWSCSSDGDGPGVDNGKYQRIELTPVQQAVIDGYTGFSCEFFKNIEADATENVVVSPWGAANILSMASNGGDDMAKESIARVLGVSSVADINAVNKYMHDKLLSLSPSVDLSFYRSLWVNNRYSLYEDFMNAMRQDYYADCRPFASADDLQRDFDSWVSQKSRGMIPNMNLDADDLTIAVLADLMYFKGQWYEKFDKAKSHPGVFNNIDGSESNVTMMEQTLVANWYSTDCYDAISLAFGRGEFRMMFLLPANGHDVNTMVNALNAGMFDKDNFQYQMQMKVIDGYRRGEARFPVTMPRFEASFECDLDETFKALGVEGSWTGVCKNATDVAFVSRQKSKVEVDEEGAKAATVTNGQFVDTNFNFENGDPFVIDRPFVYIIMENSTGVILQMGKIVKL